MKWKEIEERLSNYKKEEILIRDFHTERFSAISVIRNGVRMFDIRRPQMKKLIEMGYVVKLEVF